MDIITLAPGNGAPYYLVLVVIGAVNLIRWLLYKSKKPWTNKIGGKWIWISIAAAISVAICVGFKINIIKDVIDIDAIGNLQLTGYTGYVVSGLSLSLSSNLATFIASIPSKMYIKDLESGNPIPGTVSTVDIVETPVEPSTPTDAEFAPVDIPPEKVYYKTRFLVPWVSNNKPKFLLLERDDGAKRIITLSDEEKDLQEAWSKISNLEV